MRERRKCAFDSVPGGCLDGREKQRNYGELAEGTAALADGVVENALPFRTLSAVAREEMFCVMSGCRLRTDESIPRYLVRQRALEALDTSAAARVYESRSTRTRGSNAGCRRHRDPARSIANANGPTRAIPAGIIRLMYWS